MPRQEKPVPIRRVAAPKDRNGVAELIRRIGDEQVALNRARAEAQEMVDIHQGNLVKLAQALQRFAGGHREEWTRGGEVKFVDFPTGQVWWNEPPLDVKVTGDKEELAKAMIAAGLGKFLQPVLVVDVETVREHPGAALRFGQIHVDDVSQFKIKPKKTGLIHTEETRVPVGAETSEAA